MKNSNSLERKATFCSNDLVEAPYESRSVMENHG